jgi:hypothetical protein
VKNSPSISNARIAASPAGVVWEENGGADLARGPERKFIAASEGFHPKTGRTGSGDPLIVCERCGAIQPD